MIDQIFKVNTAYSETAITAFILAHIKCWLCFLFPEWFTNTQSGEKPVNSLSNALVPTTEHKAALILGSTENATFPPQCLSVPLEALCISHSLPRTEREDASSGKPPPPTPSP